MWKTLAIGSIIWVITILPVFSQVDTTLVCLPIQTVRLITKDLLIGDQVRRENTLLNDKISLLERRIKVSDSIITGKDSLMNSYRKIGDLKTKQIDTFVEKVNYLEKDIKRKTDQRNLLFYVNTILLTGLVTLLIL
jgi:hypothetical protein